MNSRKVRDEVAGGQGVWAWYRDLRWNCNVCQLVRRHTTPRGEIHQFSRIILNSDSKRDS
jgi:hypothetical protein